MEGRKRKSESPSGSSKVRKTGDVSEHTDSSASEPGQTSLETSMEIQMAATATGGHFTIDSPDQHLRPAAPTPTSSEIGPPTPMLISPENPSPPIPLRSNSPENFTGGSSSSVNLANVVMRLRRAIIGSSELNFPDPNPNAPLSCPGPDNPLFQGPHLPVASESETTGIASDKGSGSVLTMGKPTPHVDDPGSESDSDNQI